MFLPDRSRRKLVVFTEHRDTLNHLVRRIRTMLGSDTVRTIHGGMGRKERKHAETAFTQVSQDGLRGTESISPTDGLARGRGVPFRIS
jgi:hypothetical protein